MTQKNWAGNHVYRAAKIHHPRSVDELHSLIEAGAELRVLGSRHSFTDLPDAGELVSMAELPEVFEVDRDAMTATVSAQRTSGRFAELARAHDIALPNLASLPHISIAGAVATATHGSGTSNGNLATAVTAVEMITSAGETVRRQRGEADFDGVVVGLGALGAVTLLTLDVEPTFDVAQRVYEALPWPSLIGSFDEIFAAGYSVSAFTRYEYDVQQLWIKSRIDREHKPADQAARFFGAAPAVAGRHPVPGIAAEACTEQLGRPGLWSERLPHFRLDFVPSTGDEIQSEYFVAIEHAAEAIDSIRKVQHSIDDSLLIGEIRTVAADQLWMSPQYHQSCAALHFTWRRDPVEADRAAAVVADALAPFKPRPHWGKVFPQSLAATVDLPRRGDFVTLADQLDPRGLFRNDWFERVIVQTG